MDLEEKKRCAGLFDLDHPDTEELELLVQKYESCAETKTIKVQLAFHDYGGPGSKFGSIKLGMIRALEQHLMTISLTTSLEELVLDFEETATQRNMWPSVPMGKRAYACGMLKEKEKAIRVRYENWDACLEHLLAEEGVSLSFVMCVLPEGFSWRAEHKKMQGNRRLTKKHKMCVMQ